MAVFLAFPISHFQITLDIIDHIVIIIAIPTETNINRITQANHTAAANSDSPNILKKYISIKSTIKIANIPIAPAVVILLICFEISHVMNFAIIILLKRLVTIYFIVTSLFRKFFKKLLDKLINY